MTALNPQRFAHRHNAGIVMMLVLIAIAMATILSVSFLSAQSTSNRVAQNLINHTRARAIADTGAAIAIAEIKGNANWRTDHTNGVWVANQVHSSGTFSITLEDGIDTNGDGVVEGDGNLADDVSDPVTVTVVGTFNGASHKMSVALITPDTISISQISAGEKIEFKGDSVVDSYNSTVGIYGGTNVGSNAKVSTNSTNSGKKDKDKEQIKLKDRAVVKGDAFSGVGSNPEKAIKVDSKAKLTGTKQALDANVFVTPIVLPTNTGANSGDFSKSGGTSVINSNMHVNNFSMKNAAIIQISGDVTIWAEKDVTFANTAQIQLLPNAKLSFYIGNSKDGKLTVGDGVKLNPGGKPSNLIIYYSGKKAAEIKKTAQVFGVFVMPAAELKLKEDAQVFGAVRGKKVKIEGHALFHADVSPAVVRTGIAFIDTGGSDYGIAAENQIELKGFAKVQSFNGATVRVSTNEYEKAGSLKVKDNARLTGDAYCHPLGVAGTIIKVEGSGLISGTKTAATLSVEIPEEDPPEMPASVGDKTYSAGTTVINSDLHVNKLTIKSTAIVQISGDVTIVADGEVKLQDTGQIQLLPGASLTIFAYDKFTLTNSAKLNATGLDPTKVTIHHLCTTEVFLVEKLSSTVATVVVPYQQFYMLDTAIFTGTVRADSVLLEGNCVFNVSEGVGDGAYDIGSFMQVRWLESP